MYSIQYNKAVRIRTTGIMTAHGLTFNNSGKVTKAKAVYKANKICKQTLITMTGCGIRFSPQCKAYYLKKRAEGKNHNHALRCLARQMIKVIQRMLLEDRDYIIKKPVRKVV